MTHRSKEPCVGSGSHVATNRSSFTSPESDRTSNASQVARKQCVNHYEIIHVEQSINFEPNLRQNFGDGDKVNVDVSHMGWLQLLCANLKSRAVSFVGCRITCARPCEANLRNYKGYIFL
jgi:hypothetical protein